MGELAQIGKTRGYGQRIKIKDLKVKELKVEELKVKGYRGGRGIANVC